ncbi:MAG: DUF1461 domain-containing protein [Candidatus Woesearchaeota archaeon]
MKSTLLALLLFCCLLYPLFVILWNPFVVSVFSQGSYEQVQEVIQQVQGGPMPQQYSEQEVLHMQDVAQLYVYFSILFYWCWFLFIVTILYTSISWRIVLQQISILASIFVVVGILSTLFFSVAFELFHLLLFTNDLWLLPADSYLLSLFDEQFFRSMLLVILFYIASIGVSSWLWYRYKCIN